MREVEDVFRREHGRILASLIRRGRDFELAEEALQDALSVALEKWPVQGVPDNPAAWITGVAQRRLLDRLRRRWFHRHREEELPLDAAQTMVSVPEDPLDDDRLRLIFTCCHPALDREARIALTLNTLCGLRAAEIARAFLVREPAMAQRLVRAKRKIREAGIPYRIPPAALYAQRLPDVLTVVYLVFNEGYAATRGDELVRRELANEAIRLARLLVELLPDEPEVEGLLALMLLHDSRRDARCTADGDLVLLEDQDRDRWDAVAIAEGIGLVESAARRGRPGPYQVQAAIAAVHAEARDPAATDWRQIVLLYDRLLELEDSPVFELNRAVAVAMSEGFGAGLAILERLRRRPELADYLYLHAARADLLRRTGRSHEARAAYRRALALAENASERRFLERRLRELPGAS